METIEKYIDCKKEDVIRRVPDYLWCDWLERAPEEYKADEAFMKIVIFRCGECLKYAFDSLRSDKDIVLKAVRNCAHAIVYASDKLQRNRKFIKQAVNLNDEVIRYVRDEFKNDKSIALVAVRKHGDNIEYLSEEIQNDLDIIEASLGGNLYDLRYASKKVRNNKSIAIKALSQYGHVLEYVSERLRVDKEVVLAAVSHSGSALQFASDELKDNKEIVLTAIENYEGNVLEYASKRLKDDKETVLLAVCRCEYSICSASERLRHDPDVVYAVLDTFPKSFEKLPEDVQENLDYIIFGLESVVRHLPDPDNYIFFEDATSEYYIDFEHAEDDFLDILESIPREILREDSALNDKVCRLAVRMNDAYYEGDYPYQDESCSIVCMVEELYEEKDIPIRTVLKEAVDALRKESEKKKENKYKHFDLEERLFYNNLDLYVKIVGRSVMKYGAEWEKDYLSRDGGFVQHCMLSFVKDLVYSQRGLYHESKLWMDYDYEVNLNKAYEEIRKGLPPEIRVVRKAYEYYYSENVTVDVTDNIHLILVRAVPMKIIQIWVNKQDSEHGHGKWLAPDRLGEFCDMVGHIVDVYGKYEKIAAQHATELRKKCEL